MSTRLDRLRKRKILLNRGRGKVARCNRKRKSRRFFIGEFSKVKFFD